MRERHCSNETLLRLFDGELRAPHAWGIRRHVRSCWECRARLMELEEQIRSVRRAVRCEPFPAAQIEQARRRFRAWERSNGEALWGSRRLRTDWAAAFAALLLLSLTAVWWLRRETPPDARRLLVEAERVEIQAPLGNVAVRQELRVEIRSASQSATAGEVEIVAEPATGRFAVRWRDHGGGLRYACWRPDGRRGIRYEEGRLRFVTGVPDSPLWAGLAGARLDAEALERVIAEWIFSRQWRPVSLAAEARQFADGEGGTLTARRQMEQNRAILVIRIQRTLGRRAVEVVLVLDSVTRRPRLETIRLEENGQVVVIRLIPGRVELVAAAHVRSSWFEPEVAGLRQPPSSLRRAPSARAVPAGPTQAELLSAEVQALAALHDERVCLGDPVEVRQVGTTLEISGLVSGEEKKQALLARLAPLGLAGTVSVRLKTFEEAAIEAGISVPEAPPPAPPQRTQVRGDGQAVDELLASYFRQSGVTSPQDIARRVTDFSNRAVWLAEAALADAWALRRLAERFPASRAARLDARSFRLLDRLVMEHLSALHSELDRAQTLWRGPLATLPRPDAIPLNPAGWTDSAQQLFHEVQQYHTLVHSLLAGAGTLSEPPEDALKRVLLLLDCSTGLTARLAQDPGLRHPVRVAAHKR